MSDERDSPVIEAYLNKLDCFLATMPADEKDAIRSETRSHLQALVSDYINNGLEPDQAVKKAVKSFGSAKAIGESLTSAWREQRPMQFRVVHIGLRGRPNDSGRRSVEGARTGIRRLKLFLSAGLTWLLVAILLELLNVRLSAWNLAISGLISGGLMACLLPYFQYVSWTVEESVASKRGAEWVTSTPTHRPIKEKRVQKNAIVAMAALVAVTSCIGVIPHPVLGSLLQVFDIRYTHQTGPFVCGSVAAFACILLIKGGFDRSRYAS